MSEEAPFPGDLRRARGQRRKNRCVSIPEELDAQMRQIKDLVWSEIAEHAWREAIRTLQTPPTEELSELANKLTDLSPAERHVVLKLQREALGE
jgi:hypothetical protein